MTDEELERVREVRKRHEATLMARPEVQGLGIGEKDGAYALVVYVTSRDSEPGPELLDGVPVRYVFTGKFKPLI